jgi:tubby-related protein 1
VQEKSAAAAKAKQQKQEYRFADNAAAKEEAPPRGTKAAAAEAAEEQSSSGEEEEQEEEQEDQAEAAAPAEKSGRRAKGGGRGRMSSASSWAEEDEDGEDVAVRPAGPSIVEESSDALASAGSHPYIPASIDTSDLRSFLMTPGPQGAMVQCYIQRRKSGLARLFPTYEIYLKEGDKFLMAARKRKKNKSSNYLISLDKDDLSRNSGNFYGKLRSNFIGTEFTLYDKGSNPDKKDDIDLVQTRAELGCILYKQNVLGSRGPRKMKVMVPNVDDKGQRKELRPTRSDETMLERYKAAQNDEDVQILKNKPPKWNDQVGPPPVLITALPLTPPPVLLTVPAALALMCHIALKRALASSGARVGVGRPMIRERVKWGREEQATEVERPCEETDSRGGRGHDPFLCPDLPLFLIWTTLSLCSCPIGRWGLTYSTSMGG